MREVMSLQGSLSIERMCELTRVSRASFYRSFRDKHPVEEEMEVRSAIQQIAVEHRRRYGYRRIAAELRRRGMPVNQQRVMRIMVERKPGPGLVHHSDRGLQYASSEYVNVLREHQMIPSMSRPANPYDNASCESFMKTLKREEIYANRYEDLGHMRVNIEEFIEQYYNRQRLHSALGYRPPEEFEQQTELPGAVASSASATLVFFRP